MPNLVGIGNSQVPTNAMLGGLAYQDPAHANLTEVEIENIAAIKANIETTYAIKSIFVYNTTLDSDGGAWRYKATNQSWYNEPLGTDVRGTRREFPSIAVLISDTHGWSIYDGDDPNMSLWMRFNKSTTGAWAHLTNREIRSLYAINGVIYATQANLSATGFLQEYNLIGDFLRQAQQNYTYYANHFSNRHSGTYSGWLNNASYWVLLADDDVQYVSATVLPDAPIDPKTGLPRPTAYVSSYGGGARKLSHDLPSASGTTFSNGTNVAQLAVQRRGPHHAYYSSESNGGYYSATGGISFFSTSSDSISPIAIRENPAYDAIGGIAWPTNSQHEDEMIICQSAAVNYIHGNLNATSATNNADTDKMIAYISNDYNTGFMHGNVHFAIGGEVDQGLSSTNYALTANAGSTNRLTSETYDSGDTSWQMVDNASSANGYVVVEFQGLTPGQAYKITITFDNNATLDSGYNHRVTHDNGGSNENQTNFTHWNKANGSAETLTGVFYAQTASSDDLVIYANAITLNVSNFSCVETHDISGYEILTNNTFNSNVSGWSPSSDGNSSATHDGGELRVTRTAGGTGYTSAYQKVNLAPGQWYTLSGYVHASTASNGATLQVQTSTATNNGVVGGGDTVAFGNWRWVTKTFKATQVVNYFHCQAHTYSTNQYSDFDAVSLMSGVPDRSINSVGLQVYGTINREPVEPGAELLCYSGFSSSNYMYRKSDPYGSMSDFEVDTNDFYVMFWIKFDASYAPGSGQHQNIFCKGNPESTSQWVIQVESDGELHFRGGASSIINGGRLGDQNHHNKWHHVCLARRSTNTQTTNLYVDGEQRGGTNNTTDWSNGEPFSIGYRASGTYGPLTAGKLALIKCGVTKAPSADHIKYIYEKEKGMFAPNAKCTLYGSSSTITGFGFDEVRNTYHVGTSQGRSDFSGLNRINNTTNAVTVKQIGASDGLIVEA